MFDPNVKLNLSLGVYSLYYAKACNELVKSNFRVIAPVSNAASFEKMLQRWRAVGNTVFDWTGLGFESLTSRSRNERILVDQLAGGCKLIARNQLPRHNQFALHRHRLRLLSNPRGILSKSWIFSRYWRASGESWKYRLRWQLQGRRNVQRQLNTVEFACSMYCRWCPL